MITGVGRAIAAHYVLSLKTAVRIELEQVKTYCPAFYPAIDEAAHYSERQEDRSDAVA